MNDRVSTTTWAVAGFVGLIAVWEAVVRILDVRPFVLLPPSRIVSSFLDDPAFFLDHTLTTARHLGIGLLGSLVIGVTVGAGLAASRRAEIAAQPTLVLMMVTPWVAYITSIVLVVGFGEPTVLFLTTFVTVPAFVYATVGGMRSTDAAAQELFASVDASRWEVLWRLRLPSAVPALFTASRFNIGLGLAAAYFAEGSAFSSDGLGAIGRQAAANSSETLWTTILCAAALGIAAQVVVGLLERWMLSWHVSQRSSATR